MDSYRFDGLSLRKNLTAKFLNATVKNLTTNEHSKVENTLTQIAIQ